jgi:hypothetical protein
MSKILTYIIATQHRQDLLDAYCLHVQIYKIQTSNIVIPICKNHKSHIYQILPSSVLKMDCYFPKPTSLHGVKVQKNIVSI